MSEQPEEKSPLLNSKMKSFEKGRGHRPVDSSSQESVISKLLNEDRQMPLIITPNEQEVDFFHWLENHKSEWNGLLANHGAVLFRGFQIDCVSKMEKFSELVMNDVYRDNTEHQPVNESGSVQVPVDYAKDQHLLWHNENTFNLTWPTRAIFACEIPAKKGGETPLVDGRLLFANLDSEVGQKFIDKGVMYVRNYSPDDYVGLSWKKIFNTEDKKVVEESCKKQQLEYEWKDGDHLMTKAIRPAVWKHPVSGELCWINQIQHWHFSCLTPEIQQAIQQLYGKEEDFPRNCYFGDGSKIENSVMSSILDLYKKYEIAFPWQKGDAVLVDNITTAHGRNPYEGNRKILVCFGDVTTF